MRYPFKHQYIYRVLRCWNDNTETQIGVFYSDFSSAHELAESEKERSRLLGYGPLVVTYRVQGYTLKTKEIGID